MASIRAKLSYQRLKKLPLEITHEVQENHEAKREPPYQVAAESLNSSRRSSKSWLRLSGAGGRRWRRPKVRVAGLRRLLKRKVRLMRSAVRRSVAKVVRRLKEGRPYLGELFAGNYMFMQVSPSLTMGYVDKYSFLPAPGFGHHLQQKLQHGGLSSFPPSSTTTTNNNNRLSIPRLAA